MAELAFTHDVNYDKRKGVGSKGQKIAVRINAFPVTKFHDAVYQQYDVAVLQEDKLPVKVKRMIWAELQRMNVLEGVQVVYDGNKIAFAQTKLSSPRLEFDVGIPEDRPARADRNEDGKRHFRLVIKHAAEINTHELVQLLSGRGAHTADALMAVTALNVMLHHDASLRFEAKRESIFEPPSQQSPAFPIVGGLEMWRGFWTSIRPTPSRLIVNIDSVAMPFLRAGNLAEVAAWVVTQTPAGRQVDPGVLGRVPPREHMKLARTLKGVQCEAIFNDPSIPGGKKLFKIKEYTAKPARVYEFELENGQKTTLERWWKTAKNQTLRFPNLGCVRVTKTAWYPLELLTVRPGNKFPGKLSPDQVADILRFTTHKPAEKMALVRQGLQSLGFATNPTGRAWGFEMSTQMLEAEARVLPNPTMKVGKNKTVNPVNGVFDLRGQHFLKPASIGKVWGCIVFDTPAGSGGRFSGLPLQDAQNIIGGLVRACTSFGMRVENAQPAIVHVGEDRPVRDAFVQLRAALNNQVPVMVVCLLPRKGMPKYAEIKHFGDVVVGVATQCLDISKARKQQQAYFANVALKMNEKMGGTCANVQMAVPPSNSASKEPRIIFGADVAHPGPGSMEPSIAGIVATNTPDGDTFYTETRAQLSRLEIISDLENMAFSLIKRYYGKCKIQPKRIIYFRDGVSEGQFARVFVDEVRAIKAACKRLDPNYNPKLTFVVCGKRHHIRFVPTQKDDNAPAGTVVDTAVVSPIYNDFYLLSHRGMLGTSRPTHYSVLLDENDFTPDEMQATTYWQCYLHQRASRSVSICSPAYFAHLVCTRGRDHVNAQSRDDESTIAQSLSSGEGDAERNNRLGTVVAQLKPINQKLIDSAYFL